MVSDPIADFIVRLKNAAAAGAGTLTVPHSNLKENLAKILVAEGLLQKYEINTEGKKTLILTLMEKKGKIKPVEVKRISKPGRRVYVRAKDISKMRGLGTVIISTPAGLMSHRQAQAKNLGGEVLCKII